MGECYLTRREKREVTEQLGIYKIGADARPSGVVVIPNKVTTLATRVFQNDGNVTNITLPPYLQEIQARAFENCALLETIIFPQSLQTIHEYAFNGCEKLQAINVPDNIPLLKPYAFGGKNIKQLTLSSTFSPKLWDYAYADNHSIGSATISCYSVSNGAFAGSDLKTVTITDNVRILRDRAFENCKQLTTFNMGEEQSEDNIFQVNLLEIGDYCFHNSGVQTIVIPKSIKRIGEYCFAQDKDSGVHGLRTAILEEGLTSIGVRAFSKSALEDITIPQSMESIKQYAFDGCTALSTITFEDGLKSIGTVDGYCFSNCGVLSLNFPSSIERIGKYAFSNCNKLTDVTFNNDISKDALGKGIFEGCTSLYQVNLAANTTSLGEGMFRGCSALKTIELPKGFQYLGEYCFENSGLEVLTIPETISFIGSYCFNNCQLSKISLPKTLQTIKPYTFAGCDNLGEIVFDYVEETIETGQGVHIIQDYAFANSVITTLSIPYTIQEIGPRALSGSKITTLKIDKIKNSISGAPWGASTATVIWRESTLTFSSNVPFFELWISQNDELNKKKVNTVDNSKYVFEPLDNGITLNCVAYAPNKVPVKKLLEYTRTQREVTESFDFEQQAPFKIEFKIKVKSEDGDIFIDDAEITSDTTFEDFLYTYQGSIFYVNKGTNITYTVLKTGYGAVYGTIENVSKDEIVEIILSKNGYLYVDLRYPYKESPEYLKYLLDNYNFKDDENFGQGTDYCMYSNLGTSQGYIKFKTPDDLYAQNTIHIEGFMTTLPAYHYNGWYGTYNRCTVICSPDLIYPDLSYDKMTLKQSNQQIVMNRCVGNIDESYVTDQISKNGYGVASFSITTKLTNLKPNTIYFLLFKNDVNRYSYGGGHSKTPETGLIGGRWFIKRITFNSCTIEDSSFNLPTIISGDKVCLLDGMGKNELYINSEFFGSPPEYSTVIFKPAFSVYPDGVWASDKKHSSSNCASNLLDKGWGIGHSDSGLFDAGIFQLVQPINCDNYSKIKITCILDTNYTNSNSSYVLTTRAYMYVGQIGDIATPTPKIQYDWSNWTEIGAAIGQQGKYVIGVCTYDISSLKGSQNLFIGVYHGTENNYYSSLCYVTEIELQ